MLLFWIKCYDFGSNVIIFIWPIEFMGHMKVGLFRHIAQKSGRATGQAALPIPTPLKLMDSTIRVSAFRCWNVSFGNTVMYNTITVYFHPRPRPRHPCRCRNLTLRTRHKI